VKPSLKGNKILLVDDEPDIAMTFKLTLENAGFIVDKYEDPLKALSKYKPSFYDLVILDVKMAKMNGFKLYGEMKKIVEQISICFITAGEMYYDKVRSKKRKREEEQQYCKLDPDRFLQKPISNVDLVKRLEKIMMLNKSLYTKN
jgi:CheY-like chemotaxis protein